MRYVFLFIALACQTFLVAPASADSSQGKGPHIEVQLLSEYQGLIPGSKQTIAIEMRPEENWHTYWRNPGDSGEPPSIFWMATEPLSFGEIQWPLPTPIPVAHLVNYGYSDDHLLMVEIAIPQGLTLGQSVRISADLSWLVCKEDCIPGSAQLSLDLPVVATSDLSASHNKFTEARAQLPSANTREGILEINADNVALRFSAQEGELTTSRPWIALPFRGDVINHATPQSYTTEDGFVNLAIAKSDYFPKSLESAWFLIKQGNTGFYLEASSDFVPADPPAPQPLAFMDVLIYAGMALLGGLILNFMPCVLPVLSIKAMALQHEQQSRAQQFAYLAGVLVCFNAFAALIVTLQSTGEQLGWGFHMQSPGIIVLLAFLFTFIALVLWDVFTVGSRLAGVGESLVTGHSAKSHFFTGLLAVIVASPCTAPFMAAALGIAMVSSAPTTFLIFNALALGFALPMTLLFLSPQIRDILPKPGPWMQTFKHILGFPMLATVAWLCWVYAGQMGAEAQFALLLCLLCFALCSYLIPRLSSRASLLAGAFLLMSVAVPHTLNPAVNTNNNPDNTALNYDPGRLQQLRNENQIVLVNMTADWCITCKVNEQVALDTDAVHQALDHKSVHYMVGDWTNKNQQIMTYLQEYERAGVPLYVVYAGTNPGRVLPQILTPGIVVESLNNAKQELSDVN